MGKFKVVQWVIVYYPSNPWPTGGSNEGGEEEEEEVKRK